MFLYRREFVLFYVPEQTVNTDSEHRQWTQTVNTDSEYRQWITDSEYRQWIQTVNTDSEYRQWIQTVNTDSEYRQWIQTVNTDSEYRQWIQTVNTDSEYRQWIQTVNTIECEETCSVTDWSWQLPWVPVSAWPVALLTSIARTAMETRPFISPRSTDTCEC